MCVKLLNIENISKENIEDIFKICSWNRAFAPIDNPILEKGRELKRRWLLEMLERYGPCMKIAYFDDKPVAQVLYYPEEAMPFLHNPRKDVVNMKCVYNSQPEARRKGAGTALMKALVDEGYSGLECLGGRPCRFVVTIPFPHEGELPLNEFFSKYGFKWGARGRGFKWGHQEMYLKIEGKYTPRDIPEYYPLPEDRGKIILLYNPNCEWGYFFAMNAGGLLQGAYPDVPIEIYNNWERPEEYKKRPHLPLIAGSIIANAQVVYPYDFWTDQQVFLQKVGETMRQ
jgi:GNAT superfamily N-acetyltransferase